VAALAIPIRPIRFLVVLRHPGLAEAVIHALAASKIDRVVVEVRGSKPRDGEAQVQFEPARTASRASSKRSSRARAAASQRWGNGQFGPSSIDRFSHATASSSRPAPNSAAPTKYIQPDARASPGLMRSASRTCPSVSSLRPTSNFATPIEARFQSIAKARSHSAMPWATRLIYTRRTPNAQ